VTHDPDEAALLADEILVIDDGVLLQAGTRAEVYGRPASPHVARLLGIQNLAHGFTGTGTIAAGSVAIAADTAGLAARTPVLWCIRPEHVLVRGSGAYPGTVTDVAPLGTVVTATVRLTGGPELSVRTTNELDHEIGDDCRVDLPPEHISVWADDAGRESESVGIIA